MSGVYDIRDLMPHSVRWATTVNELYDVNRITEALRNKSNGKHSWYDWFLIPEERYSLEPGETKESYVDIPGANGALDYTEALTLCPVYKNIEGDMTFIVDNTRHVATSARGTIFNEDYYWEQLYTDIKKFLHGQTRYMLLDDAPEFYYYGRFSVSRYDASEKNNSKIVISYNLKPFRTMARRRVEFDSARDIYWDQIVLDKGLPGADDDMSTLYLNALNNIVINSDISGNYAHFPTGDAGFKVGPMPVIPTFTVKRDGDTPVNLDFRFYNDRVGIMAFTFQINETGITYNENTGIVYTNRQVVFTNSDFYGKPYGKYKSEDFVLDVRGTGVVSIDYDIGVL